MLNAFLLDHVQTDLEVLTRLNRIIDDGERRLSAPDFLERVNDARRDRGAQPYRRVKSLVVRPSEDIGRLAAEHVRAASIRGGAGVRAAPAHAPRRRRSDEADLASYLLFDGAFARRLIELGRADAEARRNEIADFFGSAAEDDEPVSTENNEWTIPPPVE